jgi:hypothetical protein
MIGPEGPWSFAKVNRLAVYRKTPKALTPQAAMLTLTPHPQNFACGRREN